MGTPGAENEKNATAGRQQLDVVEEREGAEAPTGRWSPSSVLDVRTLSLGE